MLPTLRPWKPQLIPYETDLQKRLKVLNQDYATLEHKYSKFYLLPDKFHRANIRNNMHLPRLVPCSSISPSVYPNSKKSHFISCRLQKCVGTGLGLSSLDLPFSCLMSKGKFFLTVIGTALWMGGKLVIFTNTEELTIIHLCHIYFSLPILHLRHIWHVR